MSSQRKKIKYLFPYEGKEYTISQLSKMFNITIGCLHNRLINMNMSFEDAIKRPSKKEKFVEPIKIVVDDDKQEKERIKKIMARPINPDKDVYLKMSLSSMTDRVKEKRKID